MRHTHYPGAAALLAAACLGVCAAGATNLEYLPPLWHDTSGNPAASPSNPRVHGGAVLMWRGTAYLVYSDHMELRRRQIQGDGSLGPASVSHFGVQPYGDRDLNLFNFAVCDDCRYGAAGFDVQGLVLVDLGTGTGPIWGDSRRWVDSGSIGAFTFKYGTRQYLIARVHASCQGAALVEITGIRPEDQRLVQCVTDAGGVPIPVDAGFWMPRAPVPGDPVTGHVWLLDSSYRRVHAYTVTTVAGDPWLDAVGWTIQAVWILDHGIDVDVAHWIAVSAYSTGLSVWDIADPAAPVLRSRTPLPFMVSANSVELRWPYVYVGTLHTVDTGSGHLFDLTDPTRPVEIDPGFWAANPPLCEVGATPTEPLHNGYPCMSNKGGAWWGDNLYLARYSVGERFSLHIEAPVGLIFRDGFEGGDTAAWQ